MTNKSSRPQPRSATYGLIACAALSLLITGCEYSRSFMNINSDSGVPFLGLQLSVDATDPQQLNELAERHVAAGTHRHSAFTDSRTIRAQSPHLPGTP